MAEPEFTIEGGLRRFQVGYMGYECPYCHHLYGMEIYFEKMRDGDNRCDFCKKEWSKE